MKVGQRRLSGWQRVLLMRFLLLVALILVLAGSLVLQSTVHAQSERSSTGTIADTAELTYGEWNAAWWQWFFSVPASRNPGLAANNAAVDCSVKQTGNFWFLAGQFNASGSFTHKCISTIPGGTSLVIPLINSWQDNVCVTPPLSVDQLRVNAANAVTPATNLHASIDGQSITGINTDTNRAISPVFSYTLPPPPNNVIFKVFKVRIPGDCGTSSSTVQGAVADGFYIIVSPLSPGSHTINFGGSGGSPVTTLNMTYTLTVGS